MLTNTGKNILAKYLIGQTNGYASHIAIGCGPKALGPSDSLGDYSAKSELDFEMFRIPISSRGYVVENVINPDGQIAVDGNGDPIKVSEIVLTAQLPTTERYEITEIGIYPALSNPSTTNNGSRVISTFNNSETWQYKVSGGQILAIPSYTDSLDKVNGVIPDGASAGSINVPSSVFYANSDNSLLDSTIRLNRHERPRFLNNSLFIKGNMSSITGTGTNLTPASPTGNIYLSANSLNLDRNSGQDKLKIAFSLLNKNEDGSNPTDVKIIVEFANNDTSSQYARFSFHLNSVDDNFNGNRYFVESMTLQDAVKSNEFSWGSVSTIKIYAEVEEEGVTSEDYYISLDGLRVENTTAQNPLYGLVGYSVIKNNSGRPIIKAERTNNLVEFRFAVDVA